MCDINATINLPPGFKFLPTDEELVLHFLYRKASLLPCNPNIIPDLDLNFHAPWQLNGKALCSGNKWYFFSQISGDRETENGYWKQIENIEEPIFTTAGKKIGVKKYLVFFIGEAPVGVETNWIMQEYHLCNYGFSTKPHKRKGNRKILENCKWVLCRVYEREGNFPSFCNYGDHVEDDDDEDNGTELSGLDEMYLSLDDDLADISLPN
ncbi:NAC domain protein [Melia azedarach]|uniref:NAC domain protein n=1 Tax=Melia azedarach TaxID=155640 RepID=A0ACC1XVH0_MELAZ|nr:NAC domain protein [Melia azedarach]